MPAPTSDAEQTGLVVASYGRHLLVEDACGQRVLCHPRGKRHSAVVGDRVRWRRSTDEGVIESVLPRRNVLLRQDELRTKTFAANLDQLLVLVAAQPTYTPGQLARALIAAASQDIPVLIALNKRDLGNAFDRAWQSLQPYARMGYPLLGLALGQAGAEQETDLRRALAGQVTLVLGASGVGKSTLVNRLVPDADATIGNLSQAVGLGRHTTTRTTLHWLDTARRGALIDSPGFQEFGLNHIAPRDLAALMPDFQSHLGQCRFADCSHLREPGCAVVNATKTADSAGGISADRYAFYSTLYTELKVPPRY